MDDQKSKAQLCQTPLPTRKRVWPSATTPNLYSAAKRRRMSLADEPDAHFEGFETEYGSTSKVDMVRVQHKYVRVAASVDRLSRTRHDRSFILNAFYVNVFKKSVDVLDLVVMHRAG